MRQVQEFVDEMVNVELERANVCDLMVLMYEKLVELGKVSLLGQGKSRNMLEFCSFPEANLHRLVVPYINNI